MSYGLTAVDESRNIVKNPFFQTPNSAKDVAADNATLTQALMNPNLGLMWPVYHPLITRAYRVFYGEGIGLINAKDFLSEHPERPAIYNTSVVESAATEEKLEAGKCDAHDDDFYVALPPVEEYRLSVTIKSIQEGSPTIIDIDDIVESD